MAADCNFFRAPRGRHGGRYARRLRASVSYTHLVGASGSGKSTLLGLLAGLDVPTAGEVRLDGVSLTALDEDELARLRGRMLGFVFQSFQLLPSLTALENVMLPLELSGRRDARATATAMLQLSLIHI